ncbi:hypothetical protein FF011L_21260 [Roseimaritima multifibrata]|uniref:Chromosome partition protein Smc n=1 Tax=Roseimaritima multifibrata TaxID=1930274 RepID=A0A517MEQ5_9BACT|nr:hypothetical protein [Roseimaritima multifibrata]QDS93363.1 hypothetical protein FF011L_21260 [Roseimaritima multifibrata]
MFDRAAASLLCLLTLTTVLWTAVPSPAAAQPAKTGEALQNVPLPDRQTQVSERYQRLEELLLRLAEVEVTENPERAALLRRAAKQSRDTFILERMNSASDALRSQKFQQAITDQQAANEQMAALLKLLLTEDRPQRIRDEKERISNWIKDLKRQERRQRGTRARTENGAELKSVESEQSDIAKAAEALQKEMAEQNKELDPAAEEALEEGAEEATEKMSEAEKKAKQKEAEELAEMVKKAEAAAEKAEQAKSEAEAKQDQDKQESQASEGDQNASEKQSSDQKAAEQKAAAQKAAEKKAKAEADAKQAAAESDKAAKELQDAKQAQQSQSQSQKPQEGEQPESPKTESKPQSPQQSAQKQLEKALERMKEAEKALEEAKREQATEKQRQAEEEIRQAIDQLEKILRQLREEEMQRELARLESRLRKMAQMQSAVLEKNRELAAIPLADRDRQTDLKAGNLANEEKQIVMEADRAMLLLREEGSSVAFPEVVQQIRGDMQTVVDRLAQSKIDVVTQGIQEDVLAALEEMIGALQKAQKDLEEKKKQEQQGEQPQQGQQGEQPLVESLAELKLIRTMQTRVKGTTERYDAMLQTDNGAPTAEIRTLLQGLAERQNRLYSITRDLVLKRNQ